MNEGGKEEEEERSGENAELYEKPAEEGAWDFHDLQDPGP